MTHLMAGFCPLVDALCCPNLLGYHRVNGIWILDINDDLVSEILIGDRINSFNGLSDVNLNKFRALCICGTRLTSARRLSRLGFGFWGKRKEKLRGDSLRRKEKRLWEKCNIFTHFG
ncbi:hypothetical protein SLEP1_g16093 [Rubroshorea leprosula]|uniref:Uncharacterized protein n=1 Tax=Rubroshorea leprosula TaxID=152421 RepID=A0AAV5IVP2_9ROSI|nr:hypothetical protein SLEP1_g16093 [Rubroshorea leprosula]